MAGDTWEGGIIHRDSVSQFWEACGGQGRFGRKHVTQAAWNFRIASPASVWKGKTRPRRLRNHLEVDVVLQVRGRCGMRKEWAEVRDVWERKGWEASTDSLVPHI